MGAQTDIPPRVAISVYAIAKNEEAIAERWYNCFKEADEVCVLDTGSTDRTVQILRGLGAKVVEEKFDRWSTIDEYNGIIRRGGNPWRFDKARNDALNLTSPMAELCFAVDMDDVIEPGWRKKLEEVWWRGREHRPNGIQYSYVMERDQSGNPKLIMSRNWIHKRDGYHWKYPLHEAVVNETVGIRLLDAKDFVVDTKRGCESDHSSYVPMLELAVAESPKDGRCLHNLGKEYYNKRNLDKAIFYLQRHLFAEENSKHRAERAASMCLIADCYAMKGDVETKKYWLWRAMCEFPQGRDASFVLGKTLLAEKDYSSAVIVLDRCCGVKERYIEYPSFCPDAWTEIPFLFLAEANFFYGDWQSSLAAARTALRIAPHSLVARKAVAEMESNLANFKEPLQVLREKKIVFQANGI